MYAKRQKDMKQWIFAVAVLLFAAEVGAQEPSGVRYNRSNATHEEPRFELPDSLAHMTPWKPDYKSMEPIPIGPVVSMTSVVSVSPLPARVTVIDNNSLRIGHHLTIGNGQAWNWSPFPNGYLDARTLSFPMPR